ncbi:hypothetical protein K9N68_23165 [Kovacikia minuta CCNUW1]|uniref:hypothetical protein n=1 Tax=Kovacikia minuta TaxID=2931930 RepID=UPI001CCA2F4E|nr:hypothetical protein [Kovacikia minuta]UBF24567.1 hypothetical protein K9N68_23165 [Kovacikia minuta CCNUW1]
MTHEMTQLKTQNSKLKTQNSKLKTQNSKLKTPPPPYFYAPKSQSRHSGCTRPGAIASVLS